jgi:hypothetical protein
MMRRRGTRRTWSVVILLATLALATAPSVSAVGGKEQPIEFDKAKILIELNATAEDAGIQMLLDAEGWERVQVFTPDGGKLIGIRARGSVGDVGMTELFFESAEPSLADLPLADLLEMFPEGEYRVEGRTVEGQDLIGTAVLSHDIPAGPHVVAPAEGGVADPSNTVIDWDPVTEPAGIQIAAYQVIVELEEPLRVFSVDLPASVTAVTVAPEFLMPGTDYKFEVLAISAGGNQTITESTFTTAP